MMELTLTGALAFSILVLFGVPTGAQMSEHSANGKFLPSLPADPLWPGQEPDEDENYRPDGIEPLANVMGYLS